jgi:hypothetical protein
MPSARRHRAASEDNVTVTFLPVRSWPPERFADQTKTGAASRDGLQQGGDVGWFVVVVLQIRPSCGSLRNGGYRGGPMGGQRLLLVLPGVRLGKWARRHSAGVRIRTSTRPGEKRTRWHEWSRGLLKQRRQRSTSGLTAISSTVTRNRGTARARGSRRGEGRAARSPDRP